MVAALAKSGKAAAEERAQLEASWESKLAAAVQQARNTTAAEGAGATRLAVAESRATVEQELGALRASHEQSLREEVASAASAAAAAASQLAQQQAMHEESVAALQLELGSLDSFVVDADQRILRLCAGPEVDDVALHVSAQHEIDMRCYRLYFSATAQENRKSAKIASVHLTF